MKKLIALLLLSTQIAFAGLPPTASKGSNDSGNVTTFNHLYPNETIYHSGINATITRNGKQTKNYIPYADFENGATTGWSQGTIGTLTNGLPTGTPTFGSGASGTSSMSTVNAATLGGSYYLAYTNSAATTAGNMIATSAISIDGEDAPAPLSVSFHYAVTSGTANMSATSSNSYAWAVYDVTNSVWLSSTGNFCMDGSGYCRGTFQTNKTTAQIRFVLYSANATSGAITLGLDDFFVGPFSLARGPARTDLGTISWSPTIGGATTAPTFGTISNSNYKASRDGDSLILTYSVYQTSAGTSGSGSYLFPIPLGLSIDSAKVSINVNGNFASTLGAANLYTSAPVNATCVSYAYNSTNLAINCNGQNTIGSSYAPLSGAVWTLQFQASVPIVGWSSNSAQSSDSATSSVSTQVNTLSSTLMTAGTALQFTSVGWDFAGQAQANGVLKAAVTGIYDWCFSGTYMASTAENISVYVNGSVRNQYFFSILPTSNSGQCGELNLNSGDLVTFVPQTTLTAGATMPGVTFSRRAAPTVLTPSVTQAFDYYGSTQTITTTPSALIEPTKLVDTVSGYSTSTGLYTAQATGTYSCSCRVGAVYSSAECSNLQFYVSGSAVGTPGISSSSTITGVTLSDDLPILQGQTIGCYVFNSGGANSTGTSSSSFSCHRVGY